MRSGRLGVLALALGVGCATIAPAPLSGGPIAARRPFSHEEFAPVLERFVDDAGQVDYAGLAAEPVALDRYYYLLSRYSPDSAPDAFPTRNDRLAYWLNAYNAAVLKTVLVHYPIAGVEDVAPPRLLFFLPRRSGFFVFQRIRLGDRGTSLYGLENRVVRRRFGDPRVHFALNCASRGCPRLRRQPFDPARLDAQLDRATREFVAETRNVRVDHAARTVMLSAIFDWYEGDFLDWCRMHVPDAPPSVLRYVAAYVEPERSADLEPAIAYARQMVPWDWSLNAQAPATDGDDVPEEGR